MTYRKLAIVWDTKKNCLEKLNSWKEQFSLQYVVHCNRIGGFRTEVVFTDEKAYMLFLMQFTRVSSDRFDPPLYRIPEQYNDI